MSIKIKQLDVKKFYEWDRFVMIHEHGTFFHLTRWQDLIVNNFKHRPYYLYSERNGEISGILPLVHVRSPFLGSVLVSTPYAVYGGILALEQEDEIRLFEESKALAERLNVKYIEFRNIRENTFELESTDLYHTFICDIPDEEEECLKRIPRKARAATRQSRDKYGLEFVLDNSRLDRLYELFVINKRNLGSPVFSKKYFMSLMDIFDGRVFIHCVLHEGRIVSAVMSFIHKEMILPYYSGSASDSNRLNANNFQYWQLMVWAQKRGLRLYDFGRSRKETGAFSFKKNMGFSSQQLNYQYYFLKGKRVPTLNPSNPKMDAPKKILQKMPIFLSRKIGPLLVRYIP